MMLPDTRAKLTYIILGLVYFAGGIEHGVSVPRGWLHWRERDEIPDHVVGLVVAAYSVATFCVAPFAGRWVDKPGRSKTLLIAGACLHIIGAVLEIIWTQQWINILARFISGLGGGVDAVVLSELCRYTHPRNRASVLSLLIGGRLLGYTLVPGLDSLLWEVLLTQKPLPERKTAASGLSLAVMWALILLLTVIFYMELCRLLPQAQDSDILQLPQARKPSSRSTYPGYAGTVRSEVGESYEVIHNDGSYSSSRPVSVPASLTSSMRSDHSNRDLLARSSEMIEEAEKYIQRMAEQSSSSGGAPRRVGYDHTRDTRDDVPNSGHGARSELQVDNEAQTLMEGESGSKSGDMSTSFNHDCDQSKPAEITTRSGMNQTPAGLSVVLSSGSLDMNSYIRRSGALPPRLQAPESVLYIMFEEFLRPDVVALLAMVMSGVFAYLCFQMMIIPVTQRFLKDRELYIIIMFCLAVILLVTVCLAVCWYNPQRRSVLLMVTGACVLVAGSSLFMTFLGDMDTDEESTMDNMIKISLCIGLYVVGVPLLFIAVTAIFTLQSSPLHLGLSQGVYHSAESVSAILAPLWIEGTLTTPYVHHSIITGLLVISLIMVCCSRKRLSSIYLSVPKRPRRQRTVRTAITAPRQSDEQQPLLS